MCFIVLQLMLETNVLRVRATNRFVSSRFVVSVSRDRTRSSFVSVRFHGGRIISHRYREKENREAVPPAFRGAIALIETAWCLDSRCLVSSAGRRPSAERAILREDGITRRTRERSIRLSPQRKREQRRNDFFLSKYHKRPVYEAACRKVNVLYSFTRLISIAIADPAAIFHSLFSPWPPPPPLFSLALRLSTVLQL